MKEPLPPATVKRLLVAILADGMLAFTKHAYEEMAKDQLTEVDVATRSAPASRTPASASKAPTATA